eukprot:353119-Chlamydomonas_euryale.AAC.3
MTRPIKADQLVVSGGSVQRHVTLSLVKAVLQVRCPGLSCSSRSELLLQVGGSACPCLDTPRHSAISLSASFRSKAFQPRKYRQWTQLRCAGVKPKRGTTILCKASAGRREAGMGLSTIGHMPVATPATGILHGWKGVLEKNALPKCPNLLIYVDIPRSGTRTRGRVLRSNKGHHSGGGWGPCQKAPVHIPPPCPSSLRSASYPRPCTRPSYDTVASACLRARWYGSWQVSSPGRTRLEPAQPVP